MYKYVKHKKGGGKGRCRMRDKESKSCQREESTGTSDEDSREEVKMERDVRKHARGMMGGCRGKRHWDFP